jgi:cobaltochelatase CobS
MSIETKVLCRLCCKHTHSIKSHLSKEHTNVSLEEYTRNYPDSPLYSKTALEVINQEFKKTTESKQVKNQTQAKLINIQMDTETKKYKSISEIFGVDPAKCKKKPTRNNPNPGDIVSSYLINNVEELQIFVPKVDKEYVFPADVLINIAMAIEINIPMLLWGLHGTGKSTLAEQYCARTNRPAMRIQHTISTEESHIVGQYIVKDRETQFELGPLAYAMKHGLVYIADEYDFALPNVLSLYQPVLEGKALIIKDAPISMRVIEPHANFRFIATGNTNGNGDETGLYQGTQLQNAANYSRFGVTLKINYLSPEIEKRILEEKIGLAPLISEHMIDFATEIRKGYARKELSITISPRELFNASTIGLIKGMDWKAGINLAFANRLNEVDVSVVEQITSRIFDKL